MINGATFDSHVQTAFDFLRSEYGYEPGPTTDHEVHYQRGRRFVEVRYDAGRSHELTIWVGHVDAPDPPLELADVLRSAGCADREVEAIALMQASDESTLFRLLDKAADALRRFGSRLLEGDPAAIDDAKRLRSERAATYTQQVHDRSLIEEADRAWRAKDYARVRDLLTPIRSSLGKAHQKRLEYVESHRERHENPRPTGQ